VSGQKHRLRDFLGGMIGVMVGRITSRVVESNVVMHHGTE
jgi:hypothetical protein